MKKRDDGIYKVIDGGQIANIDVPKGFWEKASEEQYKQFVENSQDFFSKYENGDSCDDYTIGENTDALYVYEHVGNCICVKEINGLYYVTSNGRHRLFVARKYNLKILVYVEEKPLNKNNAMQIKL